MHHVTPQISRYMTSSLAKFILKILYTTALLSFISVPAYAAPDETSAEETAFTEWTEPAWIMDGEAEPAEVLLEWKFRDGERPVYVERQTTTITVNGKVKKGAHSVRVEYYIKDHGDGMARVDASWKELAAKGSGVEFLQFIKRSRPTAASFTVAPDGKYRDVEGIVPFRSLPSFPDMPVSIGSKWEGPVSVDYAPGISGLMAEGTVSYLLAGLADIGGSKWANITFEGDVAFNKGSVALRKGIGIKRGKTATEAGKGVIISGISEGLAADKAGLRDNDIIFKYGDLTVNSWSDLRFAASVTPAGEPVELVILRGGASKKVTVMPEATLSADIKSSGNIKGVLVFDVTEGVLLRLVVSRLSLSSTITEGERKVEQVLKIKSLSDLARHPRAAFPAKIGDGATAFAFSSSDSGKRGERSAFKEKKPSAGDGSVAGLQIVDDTELEDMAEALIDEEDAMDAGGLTGVEEAAEEKAATKASIEALAPPAPALKPVTPAPLPVAALRERKPAPSTLSSGKGSFPLYFVSVASFRAKDKALEKMASLEKDGYSVEAVSANVRGSEWHRVLLGPFHSVSEAKDASHMIEEELGIKGTWVVTRRKSIEKAPPSAPALEASISKAPHDISRPAASLRGGYAVAIGSFRERARAGELAEWLKSDGYDVYLTSEIISGVEWQRVLSGPYRDLQDAREAVSKITAKYDNLTPWVLNPGIGASPGTGVKAAATAPAVKTAIKETLSEKKTVAAQVEAPVLSEDYKISIASFTSKVAAKRLVDSLNEAGYNAFISDTVTIDETWYRVAVGFYSGKSEAELFMKVISEGFNVKGASVRKASPEEIKRHKR